MVSVYELKVLAKEALRLRLVIVLIVSNLRIEKNITLLFLSRYAGKPRPARRNKLQVFESRVMSSKKFLMGLGLIRCGETYPGHIWMRPQRYFADVQKPSENFGIACVMDRIDEG
jgi:hypothetical protein